MAGYTRQSTFADGDTITAALFNNEYNQLLNAFSNTTGHSHDGTANEGPVIGLIGDAGVVTPLNKVLIDSTNDHIEFWIDVSSSAVQQLYIADGAIVPVTDNDIDLGTSSLQFKDLYINGTANIDSLVLATGSTVTAVLDEDDLSSDSATSLVTQQSVKAYIDAQVTAQDLDFLGDTGGALSIDLDSESLTIAGGTGLDTVGSGNTVTVNIDATVATLTGSQTLTNKTIDVDNNTVSNIEVDNFKASAIVLESEGIGSNDNDTSLPTSAAVKDYVDTQITAEDLDITTDSGTIAIDLDSETLTVSGGTGLDSSATGNAVTLAIDSTVTTLTGSQTLTNKTLTSPDINTPDIDGGTIDGATIATSDVTVGAGKTLDVSAGTLTLADNQISGDKVEGGTIAATTITDLTFGSLNDGTITATAFVDEDNMASNSATLIPTQQSVKAYVDTTVAATNEVVEDTTPQLGGDLSSNGNDILFADNDKAIFGAGSDLQIYHDGSDSYISDAGTGSLIVRASDSIKLQSSGAEFYFQGIKDGAVKLYYDNTETLVTTSTGIDVTGTATMDGLTVSDGTETTSIPATADRLSFTGASLNYIQSAGSLFVQPTGDLVLNGSGAEIMRLKSGNVGIGTDSPSGVLHLRDTTPHLYIQSDDGQSSKLLFGDATDNSRGGFEYTSSDAMIFMTNNLSEKMRIDSSGKVGIGMTANSGCLLNVSGHVRAENSAFLAGRENASLPAFSFHDDTDTGMFNVASNILAFSTAATERMRIDSSGNVGIGTDSPSEALHVHEASTGVARMRLSNTEGYLEIGTNNQVMNLDSQTHTFRNEAGSSEYMRIDSSGNLLVGTTSADPAGTSTNVVGTAIGAAGYLSMSRDAATVAFFNRKTLDGNIIDFRKDGSPVGSIGTIGSDLTIGSGDTGLRFNSANDFILPFNTTTNASRDAAIDLGLNTTRFKDLWLSGNSYASTYRHDGDSDTYLNFPAANQISLVGGGSTLFKTYQIAGAYGVLEAHGSGSATYPNYTFNGDSNTGMYRATTDTLAFTTGGSERMRIDSSGNVDLYADKDLNWRWLPGDYIRGKISVSSANNMTFTTAYSERMRINSSGSVGIGTNNPDSILHIEKPSGNNTYLQIKQTGVESWQVGMTASSTALSFLNSGSERMRIDASGNLLVGTTSNASGQRLHLESAGQFGQLGLRHTSATSGKFWEVGPASNNTFAIYNQTPAGVYLTDGGTSWTGASDESLKENIVELTGALDKVKNYRCVEYNFIADETTSKKIGFIAQDWQEDYSQVVSQDPNGNLGIQYTETIPVLLKAIQEQQTQIDALQSEINLLKGE